ncbi:MAG: DUF362 domain-containing protein [Victivallales bacterium]|nr:DUF362 domain-containing protein [Victivallales bacterium]
MMESDSSRKATVSLVRLDAYEDQTQVDCAMREALAPFGGMGALVSPGQRVLLKPNLVAPLKPELAVTTHPAIVRAAVRLVREAGGICFVGDGPGVGGTVNAARGSGLCEVAAEEGAEILEFSETAVFENDENRLLKRLELARQLKDIDVLITLPKLKTHCQMAFTGALKNQYGLIPGAAKGKFHFRFQNRDRMADLMIDINRTARPALAIMDAVVGMEGPGPSGGTPRKIGAIIAGTDLTAVDTVAFTLIGLRLEDVPVSVAAKRGGYGTADLQDIDVVGVRLSDLAVPDFKLVKAPLNIMKILPLPQGMLRWIRRQVAPAPWIDSAKCIRCRGCENGCPVTPAAIHPLALEKDRLDESLCIRCYCCHEFCPVKAIELRRSLLSRIVNTDAVCSAGSKLLGWLASVFRTR